MSAPLPTQPTQPLAFKEYDCQSCGERYVGSGHKCVASQTPKLVKHDRFAPPDEVPAVGDPTSDNKGSGARWNQEKTPYEFIPLHLLAEAAEVFELVTTRQIRPYPMWNWAKGMPWLVPWACLLRHGLAWFRGEDFDTGPNGSGKRHTAHMMCNLLMMIHYEQTFPEGDNRPTKWFSAKQEGAKDA